MGREIEQKHSPEIHPEFVGGTCTCGVGPVCLDCYMCFNCGRMDFGPPAFMFKPPEVKNDEPCNNDDDELEHNPRFMAAMEKIIRGLEETTMDFDKIEKVEFPFREGKGDET